MSKQRALHFYFACIVSGWFVVVSLGHTEYDDVTSDDNGGYSDGVEGTNQTRKKEK